MTITKELEIGQIWERRDVNSDSDWSHTLILLLKQIGYGQSQWRVLQSTSRFNANKNQVITYTDQITKFDHWRLAVNQDINFYGMSCAICFQYYEGAKYNNNYLSTGCMVCWQCEL